MHKALDSVGKDVLLVKGNKVIGEARSVCSSRGITSIIVVGDKAEALVAESYMVKALRASNPDKMYRWSFFKFCTWTGAYAECDDVAYFEPLSDVRAIDKHIFDWRLNPEFADVEGYGNKVNLGN